MILHLKQMQGQTEEIPMGQIEDTEQAVAQAIKDMLPDIATVSDYGNLLAHADEHTNLVINVEHNPYIIIAGHKTYSARIWITLPDGKKAGWYMSVQRDVKA